MTIYAIGDIHGHVDKLDRALALIEADGGPGAEIVFVGDYVDRGPDSRAVIQALIDGTQAGKPWTCLAGNHDRMMAWFFEDEPRHDPHLLIGFHWFHDRIGGIETLASYGIDVPKQIRMNDLQRSARPHIPDDHLSFLRGLKTTQEAGPLLFVHAGIRPGVPLAEQTEEDLVWIRQEFHHHTDPHPWLIVHGHTPVETPTHFGNRVDIDSGAAFGRPLIPVAIEGRDVYALTDAGRVPLTPPDSRA